MRAKLEGTQVNFLLRIQPRHYTHQFHFYPIGLNTWPHLATGEPEKGSKLGNQMPSKNLHCYRIKGK